MILDCFRVHKILIGFLMSLAVLSHMGILCSHWRDFHRHHALRHMYEYQEKGHETLISNEENRHQRHEESLEYSAKFAETAREQEHEHEEALKRDHELVHESFETSRENKWNSRSDIANHPKDAVIDERKAKSFLKQWPKYQ